MTAHAREDATDVSDLTTLRRWLHQHPQTGFGVEATAEAVAQRLEAAGLQVTRGVGGPGVVATMQWGTSDRAIGLRADLDALPIEESNTFDHRSRSPGAFHGCGHDGHVAMLVGAAASLADRDDLDGRVHLIFQPDEENGRGAQAMIDDGLFDRFPMDAVYGLHNLPGLAVGTFATQPGAFTAYEERFEIRIEGRGGHASAPELTVDPMVVGAQVVLGLQAIVARSLAPRDHGVVSVTEFVTDGAPNIIPTMVTIRGDVRGYDEDVSTTIRTRMEEIVQGTAAAHGATALVEYQRAFEPTVNTAAEVDRVTRVVDGIADARLEPDFGRVGFSEDFAQYLQHRPGCFVLMGNGVDGPHATSLHNPGYDFNDAALPVGVAYWTHLVRDVLAPPA